MQHITPKEINTSKKGKTAWGDWIVCDLKTYMQDTFKTQSSYIFPPTPELPFLAIFLVVKVDGWWKHSLHFTESRMMGMQNVFKHWGSDLENASN